MLKYTICFIKKDDHLLLLNRNKQPAMGLWNGVGGKIEANESPIEGIIRETFEETGIELKEVCYAGNVILQSNNGDEGMYVFMADLPAGTQIHTPMMTDEGVLDWKAINWILDPKNAGIVSNLKKYLPKILEGEYELEHKFNYENDTMLDYSPSKLTKVDILKKLTLSY